MRHVVYLFLLIYPAAAFTATIHVPAQYETIQSAIDAASDGDTVMIADGTYSGPGNVKLSWDATQKHLVIKSENGPEACIIDCQDEYRGFILYQGQDHRDVIEGLTITHGRAQTGVLGSQYTVYTYDGGAILLRFTSPQIRNCHLVENAVGSLVEGPHIDGFFSSGGAIMCGEGSAPLIEGNLIQNNYASQAGAGIYYDEGASGQLINNVIAHNQCRFRGAGGGIYMRRQSNPLILGNLIIHNTVVDYENGGQGGGIFISNSNPVLANNTIAGNSTRNQFYNGEGGGIWIENEPFPVILNCILWENSSSSNSMDLFFPYLDKRLDLSYSLIRGGLGEVGVMKPWTLVDAPPGFADPENDDYRLKGSSPCRDSGDPDTSGMELPETDLAGNLRLVGERIDMGAYEFAYPLGVSNWSGAGTSLQLYPNPSEGLLHLRLPYSLPEGPYIISIIDVRGRIQKEFQFNILPGELKFDGLKEGIYLIGFRNPEGPFYTGRIFIGSRNIP